jgi:hypothetical protein
MLAGMTSTQLTEWMVYMKLENERIEGGKKGKDLKSGAADGDLKQFAKAYQAKRDAKKGKALNGR